MLEIQREDIWVYRNDLTIQRLRVYLRYVKCKRSYEYILCLKLLINFPLHLLEMSDVVGFEYCLHRGIQEPETINIHAAAMSGASDVY